MVQGRRWLKMAQDGGAQGGGVKTAVLKMAWAQQCVQGLAQDGLRWCGAQDGEGQEMAWGTRWCRAQDGMGLVG